MKQLKPTHYMTLGVPPISTDEELKKAYRAIAVDHHPDKGGDPITFAEVTLAYGVLKSAHSRALYDAKLKIEGNQCKPCNGSGVIQRTVSFTKTKKVWCVACSGTGQRSM